MRETSARPNRPFALGSRGAERLERAAVFLVPFALVTYLGFAGGGFDPVIRGRVGIVIWWLVLLGTMAGLVNLARLPRAARAAIVVLAALAVWTGVSMIWSESAARSADELARASTYLGILVLAVAVSRRGRLEWTLAGVGAAIAVIVGAAVLSRLQPGLFPTDETAELIEAARARLNYPLNYWNGLASLIAIGAPLLIHLATFARSAAARALATASLPLLGLALYLTLSRGGAAAVAAGLLALVAIHPRRLALLPQLAIGAAGSLVLVAAANARPAFTDGLETGAEGDEMTVAVVIVCALAGLARLAVSALARRRPPPQLPRPSGPKVAGFGAGAAALAVAAALALGVPGEIGDGWENFKDPEVTQGSERLGSASGNGRYQYWDAAVSAYDSAPILGIGAGAYRFWWTREGSIPGEVVDAHSLYLETLGELGIVGFVLIVALVGGSLVAIFLRTRVGGPRRRREAAALGAAAFAFAVGAGIDWSWELPVLPAAFLILVGAALAQAPAPAAAGPAGPDPARLRWAVGACSVVAALVIVPPMLGATALRDGQERAEAGDLRGALRDANWALRVEPYSGAASLQKALVLEQLGRISDSEDFAVEATQREPTNWQTWLALSRIENELSNFGRSNRAYRRARSLNPTSKLFD